MKYQARRIKKETFAERLTTFLHNNSKIIGSMIGVMAKMVIGPLTMIGAMVIANRIESSDNSVFGTLLIWVMCYVLFIAHPLSIGIQKVVMKELQHQMLKHIQY